MRVPITAPFFLAVLVLAGSAVAQTTNVRVSPSVPSTSDVIFLGIAPPADAYLFGGTATVTGNHIRVDVYGGLGGCPILCPPEVVVRVGLLGPGVYTYEVFAAFDAGPPTRLTTGSFEVQGPWDVPLSPAALFTLFFALAAAGWLVLPRHM